MIHTTGHEIEFLQSLPLKSLVNYAKAFRKRSIFKHVGATRNGSFETSIDKNEIEKYLNQYVNLGVDNEN